MSRMPGRPPVSGPAAGRALSRVGRLAALPAALALLAGGCGPGGDPLSRLNARLELKRGNQSYISGDYARAVAHYDRLLAIRPDSWRAHLNKAYGQVAQFRLSKDAEARRRLAMEAIQSFEQYEALRATVRGKDEAEVPSKVKVEQYVLTLLLDSGQTDQAIARLKSRLAADPRDVPAVLMLSSICVDRGDLDQAAAWLRRRIEIEPDKPEAHYAFGVFAWRVSYYNMTGDAERRARLVAEGKTELEAALDRRPNYFEACTYLNLLYREMARFADDEIERTKLLELARRFHDRALELKKGATPPVETPAKGAG